MADTHLPVAPPKRINRGLRTALGAGVDVVGPGRAFLNAPPPTNPNIPGLDDGSRVLSGISLVDRWPDPTKHQTTDERGSCFGLPDITDLDDTDGLENITEAGGLFSIVGPTYACSTFGIGAEIDTFGEATLAAFADQVWFALASGLWRAASTPGHSVFDNTALVTPANGYTAWIGLGNVEAALAADGRLAYGVGLIHVPYALLPYLVAEGLVIQTPGSNRFVTAHGNTVVADPAYQALTEVDGTDITAPDTVIAGTPPITVWVSAPYSVVPTFTMETNDLAARWAVDVVWGWPAVDDDNPAAVVAECVIGPCGDPAPEPEE